jgi:hypothetical protein
LQFQIRKRGGRTAAVQPEFTMVGDDRVIGSTVWLDELGERIERYQVLTIRDGKIVDLQGCETRRQAERFARRKAA